MLGSNPTHSGDRNKLLSLRLILWFFIFLSRPGDWENKKQEKKDLRFASLTQSTTFSYHIFCGRENHTYGENGSKKFRLNKIKTFEKYTVLSQSWVGRALTHMFHSCVRQSPMLIADFTHSRKTKRTSHMSVSNSHHSPLSHMYATARWM